MRDFTPQEIDEMSDFFSNHRNKDVLEKYGITQGDLNVLKARFHFRKDPEFIGRMVHDRQKNMSYGRFNRKKD